MKSNRRARIETGFTFLQQPSSNTPSQNCISLSITKEKEEKKEREIKKKGREEIRWPCVTL
jgi:hypothetical protein